MKYSRCFLHVDMDAFFASVEQHDHPEWKGKPVIVGGLPGEPRSVVSTASYEARKFGVHSAMPVAQAYKLCPHGIYTHGSFQRYAEVSRTIMKILKNYSPDVQQISIDEASVEITGTEMLFGPPEQIALQIQKDVFDETGLTVSVGLASTRYLAKLSSEVKKPNGFFQIPPGEEENFMLSLPLEKVWGIGKKTLEKLNKCGFYTTRQIHQQSLRLLSNLFGESCGNFLYNTVRGIEVEQQTASTHSISAETTFPFDITDLYTAETQLMELCHTVVFRMKNEHSYSKTAMLKIRYDDFSTFTARTTSQDCITTLDELFDRVRQLFEKKYEKGRGIRLLGVGLENVLSEENSPKQEMLFDFGSKKKQAVENAILSLSNKHPEIKIKKARLIEPSKKMAFALIFASSLLAFAAPEANAQEKATVIEENRAASMENTTKMTPLSSENTKSVEAAETLFAKKIKNAEIEFLAQGYWQGEFTGGITTSYGESTGNEFSGQTPVFKQQVDMSLWFMINRQWYFQAAFADEFNKNTVAAGFYGKEKNSLKEVKIANRGIVFPQTYSIELFNRGIGGGNNQAPGIYAHFADPNAERNRWQGDFAVRYDMTEQHDATFFGKNSMNTNHVDLGSYIRGMFFVLPANTGLAERIKSIYIEAENGSYLDKIGRKFKKISSEEYLTVQSKSMLVISSDSGGTRKNGKTPAIIVEFSGSLEREQFGDYSKTETFLGEIQDFFGSKINLSRFSYDFFTEIDGKKALLIQNSAGFSPFTVASYYDLGIADRANVIVGSKNTELRNEQYSAEITEDFDSFLNSSFVNKNHAYAHVFCENQENNGSLTAKMRYPLANELPGIYLDYAERSDIALLVQSFTPVKNFDIGTDASAGSVRVYKNNVLDSEATYNKETGTVTLSSPVSEIDKIYITWNEDSTDGKNGALAAQAGFSYNFSPFITMDFSASTNWTISPYKEFAEYKKSAGGYATLETGVAYTKETIAFSNALAATIENQNVTGLYRIDGMENAMPSTYYLGKKSGFILKNGIIPKIENLTLLPLSDGTQNTDSTVGLTDSNITGYKIPLEWNFTDQDELNWAAVNIHLPAGYLLSNGTEFRIALKNENITQTDFDLYLQLGVEACDDPSSEFPEKIPCWKISSSENKSVINQFYAEKDGWQIVRISISDFERSCFASNHDARLIAVSRAKSKGFVTAGPYEIITQSIFTEGPENLNISSEQIKDNTIPDRGTFNEKDNYVQKIHWNSDSSLSKLEDSVITASKYFSEVDFSKYENFKFLFKLEQADLHSLSQKLSASDKVFVLTLDRNSTSISSSGKLASKVELNRDAFKIMQSNKNIWHSFSLNLFDKTVEIDGVRLPEDSCRIYVDTKIIPTRFKIEFSTVDIEKNAFTKGILSLDELTLENSSANFHLQDIADLKLEKNGKILQTGDFTLLENARFRSRQNSGFTLETNENKPNGKEFSNNSSAEITVATIKLNADLFLSSAEKNGFSSAAQEIGTTTPLFKVISFNDRYIFDHSDRSLEKKSSVAVDFSELRLPLKISGETSSSQTRWAFENQMKSQIEYQLKRGNWSIGAEANAGTEQKSSPTSSQIDYIEEENYFSGYKTASKKSFDKGDSNASSRKVYASAQLNGALPWAKLSPVLQIQSSQKYSATSTIKYSDETEFSAEFPFTLFQNNFKLTYKKSGGGTEFTDKGGSYGEDLKKLGNSIYKHDFILKTMPIYDMFANLDYDLLECIKDEKNAESLKYSGTYSFSWKRPVFRNYKDIFIPTSLQFSAQREIVAASDSSDMYIYKASVLNTPFNLFGSQSTYRLFKWYKTDEFTFSFSGTAKIPKSNPADALMAFSTYIQSSFYIKSNDILSAGAEYSIQTDNSWTAQATINYKRYTNFSPFLSFCKLIYKKNDYSKIKLERTNSFDMKLNKTEEKFTQNYELSHKLNAKIGRYLSLYGSAATTVSYDSKEIFTLNLTGTIGGKVEF